MPYKYDIFVSYRWHSETVYWLEQHFLRLIDLHVGQELRKRPQIFVDRQIEVGSDWPTALGKALSQSRILLPLWAGDYFSSAWCVEELAHILLAKSAGLVGGTTTTRSVVPAAIHDSDPKHLPNHSNRSRGSTFRAAS